MEKLSNLGFFSTYFPYPNLKKVSDLIYYEGPILSHFSNNEGADFFYLWIDNDSKHNRWLIFEINRTLLINYLYKNLSLRELILKNRKDFVLITDINEDLINEFNTLIQKNNIPEVYLPKEDSYFEFSIPDVYKSSLLNIVSIPNIKY